MEQFSRECLEIDTQPDDFDQPGLPTTSSMDKVYDRAAKLVKRTLDVEHVIVMDVTHCDVVESMNAEGNVSVTMHHGEPEMEMTKRELTAEEYHRLGAFFEKHPDGKISEGIMPPCFRPFLPTHIQYALSECSIGDQNGVVLMHPAVVPIFNIDKRPFALLCAYNAHDQARRFVSVPCAKIAEPC